LNATPSLIVKKPRILILGASGMLGSTLLRYLLEQNDVVAMGTVRTASAESLFTPEMQRAIYCGIDADDAICLQQLMTLSAPDVVINCIGLIKQLPSAHDPISAIKINALLPHQLAQMCTAQNARLIHFSTDCVFSGSKGLYRESDTPDAIDLYGRTKLLGEIDYGSALTLRTSIIGPELNSNSSLLDWFLSQTGSIKGFTKAVFSGLPTVEIARVIADYVIPRPTLTGLYHVSSQPINKYALLTLISQIYQKNIHIVPDDKLVIDRSLNSDHFCDDTGYHAPQWDELIARMHKFGAISKKGQNENV
jgi:dTDP-4-dehydrorhamnose reductase